MRVGGGDCLKHFEREWNRRGEGIKDFKKGEASWVNAWVP